ncbi:MAG: host-nuclease inhibitor Gam family protein [FCB group bacterium]|nr:host-nuclease inhibitor Gam family protein [FCB group bacterium]
MNELLKVDVDTISELPDYEVLTENDSFLVIDVNTGEYEEVMREASDLLCKCFLYQVSPDKHCGHTYAVRRHLDGDVDVKPMDQARADYFLSRVAKLDAEIEQNQRSAELQVDRVTSWMDKETIKLEKRKAYFLHTLEEWMRSNQLSSKNLVNGKLTIRKQPVHIEIIDEEVLLADPRFCRVIPEKQTVNKRILRKHVVDTGEKVPGVEFRVTPPKFSYKVNMDGVA